MTNERGTRNYHEAAATTDGWLQRVAGDMLNMFCENK